jgi:hypothetical protein
MGIVDNIVNIFKPTVCKTEITMLDDYEKQLEEKNKQINDLNNQILLLQSNLSKDKQDFMNQISQLQTLLQQYKDEKTQLEQTINDLKTQYNDPIPEDMKQLISKYYNKYPPATITYSGRYLNNPNSRYALDVKEFALNGQNDDELKNFVLSKVSVKSIMQQNPNLTFWQACDEAVLKVSNLIPVNYQSDGKTYGVPEYWMFAIERYKLGAGDCEDHAHLRYVCYRIAGVPEGLLRIVCGDTKGNLGGHSTIYYLKSDGKWYHINSTSNIYSYSDWKDKDDPNDKIGIGSVWFSFNEKYAWSQFITTDAETSFLREKSFGRMKHITIKPRFNKD